MEYEMTLSQAKATQKFALRVAELSKKYGKEKDAESAKRHAEQLQKKIDELEQKG